MITRQYDRCQELRENNQHKIYNPVSWALSMWINKRNRGYSIETFASEYGHLWPIDILGDEFRIMAGIKRQDDSLSIARARQLEKIKARVFNRAFGVAC